MSEPRLYPPFHAEHVGSFLRPKDLYNKRILYDKQECSHCDLKLVEDAAVCEAIKMQREIGIKGITDGEFRRAVFYEGVFDKLEGMTFIPSRPLNEFKEYIPFVPVLQAAGVPGFPSFYCTGKIKRTEPWYKPQFLSLKGMVAAEEVQNIKITMCPPIWFHQRHGSDLTYDLSVYKDDEEYFRDLTAAYREEIDELYSIGCRHIQFDDPTFAFFCSQHMIRSLAQHQIDFDSLLSTYINATNMVFEGRKGKWPELRVSMHMCRGNSKGGVWYSEGGYEAIARRVFREVGVDSFYLEYDSERAGDFKPLRYLPLNKVAVLGLVTTKSPRLEDVDELVARVHEAADIISKEGEPKRSRDVALNQLCISPQCGFASEWEGNPVDYEDQRKKLQLIVEAAKRIWGGV